VFDVASLSKQFTAFAVAQLAHEGRLSLDEEVQKYVPELPRLHHQITIRHLVHHTSGLREYGALMELAGWRLDEQLSKSEVLDLLGRQRGLNFAPGERHEYNNTNYLLMALIVERISAQAFQDHAAQKIFRPLGMTNTFVRYPTDAVPQRAINYTGRRSGGYTPNRVWDRAYGAGVANVHTSIEDLAKWDRNFFHPLVGDEALIRTVYSPARLNSGKMTAYAYGLDLGTHRGMPTVSHGGIGGGSFHFLRLPQQRLSVATLCNRYSFGAGAPDTWTLSRQVADLYLDSTAIEGTSETDSSPAPAVQLSVAELARYAGHYWQASGPPINIRLENGRLVEVLNGKADPIVPLGSGRFRNPEGTATYSFSGPNEGTLTYHEIPTGYTAVGERRPQWSPSPAELRGAEARYCNAEVPVCWSLRLSGDSLVLQRPKFPDVSLTPAYPGTFSVVDTDEIGTRSMRLTFRGSARAPVRSFSVSRGRVSGVLFERTTAPPAR
jgi:CubicO group peptidase (beta-lactamase class C family)